MHLTFLTGEYPPMQGGIADHISYLADYIAPLDVNTSILISRRWQQVYQTGTNPQAPNNIQHPITNYRPLHLQPSKHQSPTIYPTLPNWGWRCWPAITKFLTKHNPDILHIQYQAAAFDLGGWVNWLPWYLKQRNIKTKVVTTFHDLRIPYIFPKAGPFRWKSMLALAHHSAGIICTDRENLHTLQNHLSSSHTAPNLKHIPLGNNVEPQPPSNFNRSKWRAKYGVTDKTLLLAYFGFLNDSKGGDLLIETLALLRQQGIDAQLLLIGGDVGDADPTNVAYAQQIQTLIDKLRLTAFVHRSGYVELPQVSANLLAADVLVMPYREGVSFRRTTLIAALRHACPIVSTISAKPDLIPEIVSAENMILAPPDNAPALAQAITPLAHDFKLRERLSDGAKTLGDLFEWDKIAIDTVEFYQTITDMT